MSAIKGPINSPLYQLTVPKCPSIAVWHQTSILELMQEASWLCYPSRNAEFEQHVDFKGVVLKFLPKLGNTFLLVTGQFLACSIVIRLPLLNPWSALWNIHEVQKSCVSQSVARLRFIQSQRCNNVEGEKHLIGAKYHSDKLLSQGCSPACCTCSSISRMKHNSELWQLLGFRRI